MLELVRRDLVVSWRLVLLVIPLAVVQLATFTGLGPLYLLAALVVTGILTFGSIPLEELHGTELLWSSLPLSRGQIVGGRYLTVLAGSLAGLGLSWAVGQAMVRWGAAAGSPVEPSPFLGVHAHALVFAVLILAAALYLPLHFSLGPGRALMAFSALGAGLLLLGTAALQVAALVRGESSPFLDPEAWRQAAPALRERLAAWLEPRRGRILALLCGLSLSALAFSALVSRRLYQERDL